MPAHDRAEGPPEAPGRPATPNGGAWRGAPCRRVALAMMAAVVERRKSRLAGVKLDPWR